MTTKNTKRQTRRFLSLILCGIIVNKNFRAGSCQTDHSIGKFNTGWAVADNQHCCAANACPAPVLSRVTTSRSVAASSPSVGSSSSRLSRMVPLNRWGALRNRRDHAHQSLFGQIAEFDAAHGNTPIVIAKTEQNFKQQASAASAGTAVPPCCSVIPGRSCRMRHQGNLMFTEASGASAGRITVPRYSSLL